MYTLRFLNIALSVGQVTLERAKILSPIVLVTCEKKCAKASVKIIARNANKKNDRHRTHVGGGGGGKKPIVR